MPCELPSRPPPRAHSFRTSDLQLCQISHPHTPCHHQERQSHAPEQPLQVSPLVAVGGLGPDMTVTSSAHCLEKALGRGLACG